MTFELNIIVVNYHVITGLSDNGNNISDDDVEFFEERFIIFIIFIIVISGNRFDRREFILLKSTSF